MAAGGSSTAGAQDENVSGPYVGGGYGQFDVKVDDLEGVTTCSGTSTPTTRPGRCSSAGASFPTSRSRPTTSTWATRGATSTPPARAATTSSSWRASRGYVIGTLPLGIFELSAKVGYYFHDVNLQIDFDNIGSGNGDVIESDNSGEALVYGVGAGVTFIEHINVNIEYELMDIDEVEDANTLWLTGAWRF